jgi:hypothetical protein
VIINWTDLIVQATIGNMSASDAAPLPRLGEVFFDVRGDSRSMRLSWYADTGVAVFSIWQGGMCTGTFRLPMGDLDRMIEVLQRGPQRRRSGGPDGGRHEPERYEHGEHQPGDYGDRGFEDGGYGPGDYSHGGYGDGGFEDGGYGPGDYSDGDYSDGGYAGAGYEPGGQSQGGQSQTGQSQTGQSQTGQSQSSQSQGGYGADGYGADGYGSDRRASPSRRSGGVHRSAGYSDPAGYPDAPGYADPVSDDRPPAGTRWSELPTGTYRRPAGRYQPEEYQADGFQPGEYPADGYQTAAYPPLTTDHAAAAESDLTGYGQERFVPPYVQPSSEAYPNDNPVSGQARRRGGSRTAYPAHRGGVSAEPDRYTLPQRSEPGYTDGSEYRLAADTPGS